MAAKVRFKYYPQRPGKLTAAYAKKEYDKLLAQIKPAEAANSPADWIKLYSNWNSLSAYIGGESARVFHAFNLNMADKKLTAADRYMREKVIPAITPAEHQLLNALLGSRHKKAVAMRFGTQLIPLYNSLLKPSDPVNTKLNVAAGRLTRQYDQMIAAGSVTIDGQKMTLAKARTLTLSSDRALRKRAFLATSGWFLRNRPKLAKIYSELVSLRQEMAKNLGYQTYTPLAYELNCRTDYGQKEVAQFRRLVFEYAVPLRKKLLKKQAQTLGLKELRPWDNYNPATTLPLGLTPAKMQLRTAQKVFDRLSPVLSRHYRYMLRHNLVDLENRPHKWASAYCISFADQGLVAVLCSSTGDPEDIRTLMHELGHAFQAWKSNYIEAKDLHWGTADLAEVFSFGMEFLSLNHINLFFDDQNSVKYIKSEWERALQLLCYCCVVDEFQHWIYKNSKASETERDQTWMRISEKYMPGINWQGYEKYRGLRWYGQNHIFGAPFYYIDYALATVVAAQIGALDHQRALKKYLTMCRLGGTKSFLAAVKTSGLQSPFNAAVVKKVVDQAGSALL